MLARIWRDRYRCTCRWRKDLFREWLDANAPIKADHVINAVREAGSSQIHNSTYSRRQRGTNIYTELLFQRFEKTCKPLRLNERKYRLDRTQFKPPPRAGDQMRLLE